MRWRRIAFWFSVSTLTLLVLALGWLWTADLGVFKPQLERFVTKQTGRQFSIDGDLSIDLAGHSTIIAEDLRFENAEWAERPHMIAVGRLEVRLDFWSLIRGPVIIELIDLDDASILLINPEVGDPNWVLPLEAAQEPDEPQLGIDFLVEHIEVDNVDVVLESARRTRPLTLQLDSYQQRHRDDDMLDIDFDSLLDGRIVSIEGTVGTWDALLAGRNIEFDVGYVLDTFEFTASGHIDDLLDPRQPEFDFTASGPDIDDLTLLLGLGDEGNGDIDLTGSLHKNSFGQLVLEANGNFGQTTIQSRGIVSDLRDLRNVGLDATASGPDLGRILRLFGIHQVREAPFTVRIDAETQGDTFVINEANMRFGEAQIDVSARMPKFPSVDDAVINLLIEGPDIARFRYVTGLPGAAEGAFSLGFTLGVTDEGAQILRLDLETALGEAQVNGRLGEPPDFFSSRFDVALKSDSLARLAGAYGMPDNPIEIKGAAEYVEGGIRTDGALTAVVGEVTASVDGLVTLAPAAIGSDLTISLDGPNLANLLDAFVDANVFPQHAFDFRGRMQIQDDGLRFRHVNGNIGSSSVDVDGLLTMVRGLDGTRFEFNVTGPALEEVIDNIGDLEVRQGPYELSGSIRLQPDLIRFRDFEFDRSFANVKADLDLGLPVSRKWMDFDLRGRGRDVRSILRGIERFEAYEQPFSLNVSGSLRGDYWKFDEVDIGVGESTLQAQGDVEFRDAAATTDFSLNFISPDLADAGTFDGRAFNHQPISLFAHVEGGDGLLTMDQLVAKLGDSNVSGFVQLRKGDIPEVNVRVFSDSLVYTPLLEAAEIEYDPAPEFADGRVIPDIPVPFAAMESMNVSVDVDIGQLQRDKLLMNNIVFDADLRDGSLEISQAGFEARSGAMRATARLEPAGDSAAANFELVARDFALGLAESNTDLSMTGDLDIKLASTGADLRALAGNVNGMLLLDIRGGRVGSTPWLDRIYGDLLQEVLNTINPFRSTDPYTDFECVVLPLKFDDGLMASAPDVFVSTSRIRIAANSAIDLKTEKLRVAVRTTPRRALSISAGELLNPYVQVIGTLAAPRLAVDEKGVLISGGAAIASGGLTVLAGALWDRLAGSGDACGQSTMAATEQLGDRLPTLRIEGIERPE